ncbi:MAG: FTR1 family iron permease, partial [Candidatus Hodarchaeales archaeon]
MVDLFSSLIFSSITSLREILEAALIIGIVVSYLTKINRKDLHRDVILGVVGAIILSIGLAIVLLFVFQELTDYQELIEGIAMFIAAIILSIMILWMLKQTRGMKGDIQVKVDRSISEGARWGIVSLVFFSVFREGAELTLFLYASFTNTVTNSGLMDALLGVGIGFVVGLIIAILMAYLLFKSTTTLDLKKFFNVTSIILIIFAAGLLAHGIHEIFEFLEDSGSTLANLSIFSEVWNINQTPIGTILESLFGWMYDVDHPGRFEKSVIG